MTGIFEAPLATDELRPTHIEVDLAALVENYRVIAAHVAPAQVMPILKANAYGHGLVPVARALEAAGVPSVGVAYLEEGLRLRQCGVRCPVLVLGGIVGDQIPLFLANDLSLTASSVDKLRAVEACAEAQGIRAKVHLKIDTGMERIGIHWYSAETLLEASLSCRHLDIEGIFTHFANADRADLAHARLQLERFLEVLRFYERRSLPTPLRHAANSGAILQLSESHLDLVRPGVLFYGAAPSSELALGLAVKPAMRWISKVVFFKVVKAGNPVSYGSDFAPTEMTRVVTLPVGYGDGYVRRLSGRAQVLLGGRRHPVVGRVCMDQSMVDIGLHSAWNGDQAVLLGRQGNQAITIEELAAWADTIPHEMFALINTRVPRIYFEGDRQRVP